MYRCQDKVKRNGVVFLVRKELTDSILDFKYISDRIVLLKIAAKPTYLTMIQVYTPTSKYLDEEIKDLIEDIIQK